MEQASPVPPLQDTPPSKLLTWTRCGVCISLGLLGLCIIWNLGGRLLLELGALSRDMAEARDREPIGYLGISSEQPEFKPPSCVREVEGRTYLWAGSGVKGQAGWFDVTGTKLPLTQFVYAFGRDKIKTIDYPILQGTNGEIARRIYPERPVLGLVVDGEPRAYPMTVMEKVEVVNDTIGKRILAVTYCPLIKKSAVYERVLDGNTVSLGTSGYVFESLFVLYDRATDSLWHPQTEGLTAITGPLTGKVLKQASEQVELVTWGQWQRRYPNTRVVVGADRSRGIPLPSADEVASRAL